MSSEQPEPKKHKISTTTSDDDDDEKTTTTKPTRYKRRKIAIFFAYCGVGYQGMQKNPGAKTIEGDLEEALYLSGAVPDHDHGFPRRYDWARSARTDKGVSAVGQVVSGRFYVDPPGFVDRLNSNLSNQIRIFGFKRVTASFNAKKFCDRRRYVYVIPVFALDPCSHPDRESVLASLGSGNELLKCLECSERGRKVVGAVSKRTRNGGVARVEDGGGCEPVSDNVGGGNPKSALDSNNALLNEGTENADPTVVVVPMDGGDDGNLKAEAEKGVDEKQEEEKNMLEPNDLEIGVKRSEFCYGEKEKERFNRILGRYVGSHNFHNFTTRTKAEDPSARRYIVSFDAKTTVFVEGIEFVKCEVVGQSFMLHQIRKMIGLAVAIMRNCASESLIETALQKDVNINVPTAPEVGLYLDECFFTSYNQKWKDSHEELSMKDYEEAALGFKMKHIYSHIATTEDKEGAVALWLHSLNHRNYPDLRATKGGDTNPITAENVAE